MLVRFDPACEYFAAVSADGRLRVWDTGTSELKQECVPADLGGDGARATCIAWSRAPAAAEPAAAKGKSPKAPRRAVGLGRVALGCESGAVLVWDLSTASLAATLDKSRGGHGLRVNDVVFEHGGGGATLFSCGEDKAVIQWAVGSQEVLRSWRPDKDGVRRLLLSPDDALLVTAALTCKVWDVASGECVARLKGHGDHVNALALSAGGRFMLTAATDRHVHLWRADAPKPAAGGAAAASARACVQSFAFEHAVVALAFQQGAAAAAAERAAEAAGSACLRFAVLVASGAIHIWAHAGPLDGGGGGAGAPAAQQLLRALPSASVSVRAPVDEGGGGGGKKGGGSGGALACPLFAAALLATAAAPAAKSGSVLVLALGSSAAPTFRRLAVAAAADGKGGGATETLSVEPPANLAALLKAELTGGVSGRAARARGAAAPPAEIVLGATHMPLALPTRKRANAELDDAPSLGERAAAAARASAARAPKSATLGAGASASQGASALSARALLEQALRSGDDAMLEEVRPRGAGSARGGRAIGHRLRARTRAEGGPMVPLRCAVAAHPPCSRRAPLARRRPGRPRACPSARCCPCARPP
jgi:hypothetical protein